MNLKEQIARKLELNSFDVDGWNVIPSHSFDLIANQIISLINAEIDTALLSEDEKIAITDKICKAYRTTWAEMVNETARESLIISIYDGVAKAQLEAIKRKVLE